MTLSRRQCLHGEGCATTTLQEALYCCVHHSKLSPRQIAEQLGISMSYLLDAANPDRDQHQFQARLLLPLMSITGNLAPLRFLNSALGRIDVRMPQVDDDSDDILGSYLRLVAEVGEDSSLIEKVLSDGRVTDREAALVTRETQETAEAAVLIAALVKKRVGRVPDDRGRARKTGGKGR